MKIEIWPVDTYDKIESGDENHAALAQRVMGGSKYKPDDHA